MRTALILMMAGTLALVSCGKDNNETNNGTNNGTVSNNTTSTSGSNNGTSGGTNNGETNNGTANNTTGNTSGNNGTVNQRTEPYVTRFGYYTQEDSLSEKGISVTILGGSVANRGGNERTMDQADIDAFEADFMTADTIQKMRDGWGCREITTGGDMGMGADMGADAGTAIVVPYFFEARVKDGDSVLEIQEVTGCVIDEDPAVMDIINRLDELGTKYL